MVKYIHMTIKMAEKVYLPLCLSVIACAGISAPAVQAQGNQPIPPLNICRVFDTAYIRGCGGQKPLFDAKWFSPNSEEDFGLASVDVLLPELHADFLEVQQDHNRLSDPGFTSELLDVPHEGCEAASISIKKKNGQPFSEHGVALCFGYTINYYTQTTFSGGGVNKFKKAIAAVALDLLIRL